MTLDWDETGFGWKVVECAKREKVSRKDKVLAAAKELIMANMLATPTNLARKLNCAPPNVSVELGKLVSEGSLVAREKVGREVPYFPVSMPERDASTDNDNDNDNNNNNASAA